MTYRWIATCRSAAFAATALFPMSVSIAHGADPGTRELLSPEDWRRLDASVDAGLKFLATQQQGDGSFATRPIGQPAITSLCILANLSRGHVPHEGEYGQVMSRGIDFVLKTQQPDGMLFGYPVEGRTWRDNRHKIGAYNHAIASVMLAEAYGATRGQNTEAIAAAIRQALLFSRAQQLRPKPIPEDEGGWRYLVRTSGNESDLSVTAWQIMFLRAARNAGFDVPIESIDSALAYVRQTYVPESGTFAYGTQGMRNQQTRAMAGSGILLLSLAGEHHTEMARTAGRWVLNHPYDRYQQVILGSERYHYGAYYCSQAMFQLGGEYWERFYPPFMRLHIRSQESDGSWPQEINRDGEYGNCYTTAMMILSLTPPYQMLPIYQR